MEWFKVTSVHEDSICPACGGLLRFAPSDEVLPPEFVNKCSKCGREEVWMVV